MTGASSSEVIQHVRSLRGRGRYQDSTLRSTNQHNIEIEDPKTIGRQVPAHLPTPAALSSSCFTLVYRLLESSIRPSFSSAAVPAGIVSYTILEDVSA